MSKYEKKYGSLARKTKQTDDIDSTTGESAPKKIKKRKENFDQDDEDDRPKGKEAISMSIDETNKLRAELGLAPLEVEHEEDPNKEPEQHESGGQIRKDRLTGRDFVHKAAVSLTDLKKQEKLREKIEASKNKRAALDKLSALKGLGEEDGDDNALSWVEKLRSKDDEKSKAVQRARVLDAMDEEIEQAEQKLLPKAKKTKDKKVTAGMNVEHDPDALLAGESTILVLKDKDVLADDEEETLINPTMREIEQWTHNTKLRTKKPGYTPYEEEVDDWGKVKEAKLLGKYDDENWFSAPQRSTFKLDDEGALMLAEDKQRELIKQKLQLAQEITLESKGYTVANEYYTPEEMETKFKKKSKKGNLRKEKKSKRLKADDLLKDESMLNQHTHTDLGSREKKEHQQKLRPLTEGSAVSDELRGDTNLYRAQDGAVIDKSKLKAIVKSDDESSDDEEENVKEDLSNVVINDDADDELQAQLARTRKFAQMICKAESAADGDEEAKPLRGAAKLTMLMNTIKEEPNDDNMEESSDVPKPNVIYLDSVAEYVKNLGEKALVEEEERFTKRQAEQKREKEESASDHENEDEANVVVHREKRKKDKRGIGQSTSKAMKGKWEMDIDMTKDSKNSDDEFENALGDEANLTHGLASALQHAMTKGYLEKDKKSDDEDEEAQQGSTKIIKYDNLKNRNFRKEDNDYDIEDKYKKKLEYVNSRGGAARPFAEKLDYEPTNIKLSYTDYQGEHLTKREAWRQMCWKFHGKYPSHRTTEKRKKMQECRLQLTQMNALDTPLGTVEKQTKVQQEMQQPFIILDAKHEKDIATELQKSDR